jgi:alginate O-acetyltransferase complex protein AlgI
MAGWVLFKANTLGHAGVYLQALAGFGGDAGLEFPLSMYLDQGLVLVLIVGGLGCLPVLPWLEGRFNQLLDCWQTRPARIAVLDSCLALGRVSALTFVLLASASMMLSATYNPFIYFRF